MLGLLGIAWGKIAAYVTSQGMGPVCNAVKERQCLRMYLQYIHTNRQMRLPQHDKETDTGVGQVMVNQAKAEWSNDGNKCREKHARTRSDTASVPAETSVPLSRQPRWNGAAIASRLATQAASSPGSGKTPGSMIHYSGGFGRWASSFVNSYHSDELCQTHERHEPQAGDDFDIQGQMCSPRVWWEHQRSSQLNVVFSSLLETIIAEVRLNLFNLIPTPFWYM